MQHKTTALNGDFGLMITGSPARTSKMRSSSARPMTSDRQWRFGRGGCRPAETSPAQFMTWCRSSVSSRIQASRPGKTGWCRGRRSALATSGTKRATEGVVLGGRAAHLRRRHPVQSGDPPPGLAYGLTFRAIRRSACSLPPGPSEGMRPCSPIRGKHTPGSTLRPRCFWTRWRRSVRLPITTRRSPLHAGISAVYGRNRAANPPNRVPVVLEHP